MKSRMTLMASALCAAVAMPLYAADATLYRLDTRDGTLDIIATGTLEHEPLYMVYTGEPYVVDACGSVHGLEEDRYGDKVFSEAIATVPELVDVVAAQSNGRSGTGILSDGQLVQLDFRKYRWERAPDWGFVFAIEEGAIPEAEVFIPGDNAGAPAFIDGKGRMVYVDLSGASLNHLRRVKGADGFAGVEAGVHTGMIDMDRNELDFVLTSDASGKAQVTHLEFDNEDNVSGTVETLPGDYSGTRMWFGTGGVMGTSDLYRVAADGNIHRVTYPDGSSETIADKPVHGKAIAQKGSHLFFVNVTDTAFSACPEPEPEIVEEDTGPQYSGEAAKAVALDEELQRLYAEYGDEFSTFGESDEWPENVNEMGSAELKNAFGPLLDKLDKFEHDVVNKVRKAHDALGQYGEEEWQIRDAILELTDGEYRISGAYYNFDRELRDYDKYRKGIGAGILADGRIKFQIAEFQKKADRAAELYLAAMPFAEWALKFDPENEEAQKYLATAKEKAAGVIAAEKAAIASATWPEGKEDDFRGPGDAEDLMQEVLDYMNEKSDRPLHEKGARFFAINMREDHWKVGRTNVLGEVTQYRLYLRVAQTVPDEPWFARVCDVEPTTQENIKSPPFNGIMWGGCRKMLLDRVDAWDEDILEESLDLIEEKTGLTPDDMPEDALDPSVTGIDLDTKPAPAKSSQASGDGESTAVSAAASGGDAPEESLAGAVDDDDGGSGFGWFLLLLLLAGGGGAAWYWQDKLPPAVREVIARYLPKR